AQAAGSALVNASGIGKAVADNPAPGCQCRPDRLVEVVGARSVKEERLGQRRMRGGRGVEEQGPDPLGKGRAAGVAREERIDASRLQPLREQARLRGLT